MDWGENKGEGKGRWSENVRNKLFLWVILIGGIYQLFNFIK